MIATAVALVLAAQTYDPKVFPPLPDNPTNADKAVLVRVMKECHLHPTSLYFIQYDIPREPVIKLARTNGDTQEQLDCAVFHLPPDFIERFGLEFKSPD